MKSQVPETVLNFCLLISGKIIDNNSRLLYYNVETCVSNEEKHQQCEWNSSYPIWIFVLNDSIRLWKKLPIDIDLVLWCGKILNDLVWKTSKNITEHQLHFQFEIIDMAVTFKLFQSLGKSYQTIGLDPIQSNPPPKGCVQRRAFIVFSMTQMLLSSTAFLAFKAETVLEYAASFYVSLTELFLLVTFFALMTEMGDLAKLTETFEGFITKSTCLFGRLKSEISCVQPSLLIWNRMQ